MRMLQSKIVDAVDIATAPASAAIDASYLYSISAQVIVAGSSPVGVLKLQCSNDPIVAANLAADTTPSHWSDIPNATVSVSGTGVFLVPKTDLSYQWIRALWVVTSGTGTVTVNIKTIGL